MKRRTKFLKIMLPIPLALIIAGYATVVAQDLRDEYYEPAPRGMKPESTHCPCWEPDRVRAGMHSAEDLLFLWVRLFTEFRRLSYEPDLNGVDYEVLLIDSWEDFLDGNCLKVALTNSPKEQAYSCEVAWGLWNGNSCDIEEEDLFEASYDSPLLHRSCEIAANETLEYIESVAELDP